MGMCLSTSKGPKKSQTKNEINTTTTTHAAERVAHPPTTAQAEKKPSESTGSTIVPLVEKQMSLMKERYGSIVDTRKRVIENPTEFKNYHRVEKIGEGGFAQVHCVLDEETQQKYALKIIPKKRMNKLEDIQNVQSEVKVMRHLNGYKNIVHLHGAFEDEKNVYVSMELCEGGDMFHRLLKKGHYSEADAAGLCRTMLEILDYCHGKGVVHRDLKPENFLFDSHEDDAMMKATDFGLSEFMVEGERMTRPCGTPVYVAPEVLKQNYDEKADIWSAGIILYIMLSGKVPFHGRTAEEMLQATLAGQYTFDDSSWSTITTDAKQCVERMLTFDPLKRPSAKEMLEEKWIRGKDEKVTPRTPLVESVYANLRFFTEMNKLKKRALQLMATNVKMDQLEDVKMAFEAADEDNSGTITVDEMRKVVERLHLKMPEELFQQMWNAYDIDGNGEIDYTEFVTATAKMNKIYTVDNLDHAFRQFDKDGDGRITVDEVLQSLSQLGVDKELAQKMVAEADQNDDGVIDYEEFVAMMSEATGASEDTRLNIDNLVAKVAEAQAEAAQAT